LAPLAVNVVGEPAQVVVNDALTTVFGRGFTVIVLVFVLEHPVVVFVPVTVYIVVARGDTVIEVPLIVPGSQV
jgi:hypothetical protein